MEEKDRQVSGGTEGSEEQLNIDEITPAVFLVRIIQAAKHTKKMPDRKTKRPRWCVWIVLINLPVKIILPCQMCLYTSEFPFRRPVSLKAIEMWQKIVFASIISLFIAGQYSFHS